ncbi:MAG: hypothetical protein CR986_06945 [Ignavibacteriae bacterium]|nr:MAG: hypothetical protein CR986_06945 [Ignavibacteriota bacterium]
MKITMQKKYILILKLFFLSFAITAQNDDIRLISPNGGESLVSGNRYSISWIVQNIDRVSLYYRTDRNSNWKIIASKISADLGSYSWKVPYESTATLEIKIENNNGVYDISDSYSFIINRLRKADNNNQVNTIRIMPLGNSITFDNRMNDTRVVEDKIGYRYPLYNLLRDSGYTFSFVGSEHAGSNFFSPNLEFDKNAGFPGIKDNELYKLLKTGRRYQPNYGIDQIITNGRYLNTYPADIILLHIGTNGNNLPGGTTANDVEDILDEIDAYEDSTGTEIIVFLAKIINRSPTKSFVTTFNSNVFNMVNDRISNPANDAYPDKIVIVDMENIPDYQYTISSDTNGTSGDMNDKLHPNDRGYTKIANTWFTAIKNYLGEFPKITMQPRSVYALEGGNVKFAIRANSTLPLKYQWKKNGVTLVGETDSIINISNISCEQDSSVYTCMVSNILGDINSQNAYLFVTANNQRAIRGAQIFYEFNEQKGNIIHDVSEVGDSLNLKIESQSTTTWAPNGIIIDSSSKLTQVSDNQKKYNSFKNSDEISFEIWLKPHLLNQSGPARIVTFSKNKFERNYGILQNGTKYEVWLRTTSTDDNGFPSLMSMDGVTQNKLTQLVFTLAYDDTAKLYINGELNSKKFLEGSFSNWDSSYSFQLANELVDEKPWLGRLNYLAIYNRALTEMEVLHNYNISIDGINNELNSPTDLKATCNDNKINLNWVDNSNNEIEFIISRKSDNNTYHIIGQVPQNETSFVDLSTLEGKRYIYSVSANSSNGESDIANLFSITTPLSAPLNLQGSLNEDNNIELSWEDKSNNESGYIIEGKANSSDSSFTVIDTVNNDIQVYIDTNPKFFSPYNYRVYAYTDNTVSKFSNEISLQVVNIKENLNNLPNKFNLMQNYPNPFNPVTNISYSIPEYSKVELTIYNILGQPINILYSGLQQQGYYSVKFAASGFSSGIYFCTLRATGLNSLVDYKETKKILLLK